MQKKILFTVLGLLLNSAINTSALAREQYLTITGAAGCTTCHVDENGGAPWNPGVLEAFDSNGIQGLIDFVNTATTNTTPDTAPILSQINNQWDVTVGETPLVISLQVFDQENDSFALQGSAPMQGYTLSPLYIGSTSNLPTIDFNWAPTAVQANKNYKISVYAQENGSGRTLKSNTVSASIFVWPARANAATAIVKEFKLQTARWSAGKLMLSGQVIFKPEATAEQRMNALNTLTMQLTSKSGFVLASPLKLKLNSTGAWTRALSLSSTKVPCAIKANYEGLNSLRSVKLAPANCVK